MVFGKAFGEGEVREEGDEVGGTAKSPMSRAYWINSSVVGVAGRVAGRAGGRVGRCGSEKTGGGGE